MLPATLPALAPSCAQSVSAAWWTEHREQLPRSLPHGMAGPGGRGLQPEELPLQFCFLRLPGGCCPAHGGPAVRGLRPGSRAGRRWLTWGQHGKVHSNPCHPPGAFVHRVLSPDIASGPCNCPHPGQSEDCDPHYTGDNSRVPEVKFWPEAAQQVAEQGTEPSPCTAPAPAQSNFYQVRLWGRWVCFYSLNKLPSKKTRIVYSLVICTDT